jgi:hypothetical protein
MIGKRLALKRCIAQWRKDSFAWMGAAGIVGMKNKDLVEDCNLKEDGRGKKEDGEKKGEGEKKDSSGAQEERRISKLTILGICASTIFEMFWW